MKAPSGPLRSVHAAARPALVSLLVRAGIVVSASTALLIAYPAGLGRLSALLLIVALLAAVFPKSWWPTAAILLAAAGWLLSTTGFGERADLLRLFGLAACLYLTHSLCTLAAVLPRNGFVAAEVPSRWVVRALGVVLAAMVLSVGLLALTEQPAARSVLAALAGVAAAVGVPALLVLPLRRR